MLLAVERTPVVLISGFLAPALCSTFLVIASRIGILWYVLDGVLGVLVPL